MKQICVSIPAGLVLSTLFECEEGVNRLVNQVIPNLTEPFASWLAEVQSIDFTLCRESVLTSDRLLEVASSLPSVTHVRLPGLDFLDDELMNTLFTKHWPALNRIELEGYATEIFDPWAPIGVAASEDLLAIWKEDRELRMRTLAALFSSDTHAAWLHTHNALSIQLLRLCQVDELVEFIQENKNNDETLNNLRSWCRANDFLSDLEADFTVKLSTGSDGEASERTCSIISLLLACELFRTAILGDFLEREEQALRFQCSESTYFSIDSFFRTGSLLFDEGANDETLLELLQFAVYRMIADLEEATVAVVLETNGDDALLRELSVDLRSQALSKAVASRVEQQFNQRRQLANRTTRERNHRLADENDRLRQALHTHTRYADFGYAYYHLHLTHGR